MKESKLPTAEESLIDKCGKDTFIDNIWVNPKLAVAAIESHTQAHTEGLREEIQHLKRVLKEYNSTAGKDLLFLREILDKFRKSERDPTQREYAEQMITDWITELETK